MKTHQQAAARSDHFDGRRFANPTGPALQPLSAAPRLLLEPRARWPAYIDETPRRPPALDGASAVITFIGHSTVLIQTPSQNILTDPMYSRRAGPWNVFGPRRVRPPAIRLADLPPISVVLVSHNHYDHCDLPTLRALASRFDPMVVTPLGNAQLARAAGIRRVEELDWWDTAASPPFPITLTPAHHFSARGLFDRNRALWGGFMIELAGTRIYFAGDTAYAPFFHAIRQRFGPADVALLPIGAYEPRWFMRGAHMNPHEAVQAHKDLAARTSVGIHFGTFRLTTEGIDDPVQHLAAARISLDVESDRFRAPAPGESLRLEAASGLATVART